MLGKPRCNAIENPYKHIIMTISPKSVHIQLLPYTDMYYGTLVNDNVSIMEYLLGTICRLIM